ncbi:FRG domain-containing protein [Planctobacterium marinum]|uniref:FRG domain-containing protein n=1 Tax=Planctobacterium marinum TaxID=1631968 RepID=UPI001E36263E|nr:FRG domain-containing protein [Planctobacterium marinum]MCC2607305.1 FRG domain-containing protein [Planctobacterium marinum]
MNTIIAESWAHLHELLFAGSWNDEIARYRSPFAFRGQPSEKFDLKTSLMRLGGQYQTLEKHLLRNFRKYGHDSFDTTDAIWHWLTIAQHHGLPTRMLDWTYSPLVALHFATADIDYAEQDGIIWKVNYHDSYKQFPRKMRDCLDNEGGNVFTLEMLESLVKDLEEFDLMSKEEFFIFYEPPSTDARIVNQHALFSVASGAHLLLDDLLEKHQIDNMAIVIPREIKWEVRDKLDQSNITERVLFPGLDGLSAWLKRHYSPRTPE